VSSPGNSAPRTTWSRGDKLAAGAIFALALALRLLHLREIGLHDPFFELPAADELLYQRWAIDLAGGDWLGEGVFALSPLYAYFIGAVFALFGSHSVIALIANSLLGALVCVLVVVLGRRLFDRRAALIAGAMFAADSISIFYSGMFSASNLSVPLVLLMVLAALRAHESPGALRWLGAGVALGFCGLGGQPLLLFAPLLLAWPALSKDASAYTRTVWGALLFVGVAALILPVSVRSYAVADGFGPVTADGGIAFYTGNHPSVQGGYGMPRRYPRVIADSPVDQRQLFTAVAEQVSGRELRPSEVSAFWLREGLEYISAYPSRWIRHEIRKAGMFWNAADLWEERSPRVERAFSGVRRMPLVGFGLVGPFALLGMFLFCREWRRLYLLYAVVAAQLVSSLIFSVLSRDRLSALPILTLFASASACWIWDRIRSRRYLVFAKGLIGLGFAAWLVHLPLSAENFALAYYRLGGRFAQLERWDEAIEYYGRSLNHDPGAVSTWSHLALAFEARGGRDRDAVHSWLRVLDLARRSDYALHAERAERHLRALGVVPLVAPPGAH